MFRAPFILLLARLHRLVMVASVCWRRL